MLGKIRERGEPRPAWLSKAVDRILDLPGTVGESIVVALKLLYDLEADSIPCPTVRHQGGRRVVVEWRHPVHGHRMEVVCSRSGTVRVTTQAKGMEPYTVECRTDTEVRREARKWIAWMYDEYGADQEEIESLLVVKRKGA